MVLFGGLWTTKPPRWTNALRRKKAAVKHDGGDRLVDGESKNSDSTNRNETDEGLPLYGSIQAGGDDDGEDDDDDDDAEQDTPGLTRDFDSGLESQGDALKACALYAIVYLGISVIAFSFVFEHWTIIDSIYFGVATFTTVGYGDLEPTTPSGQLFTIFFAVFGVLILGIFIGIIGHAISETQAKAMKKLKQERQDEVLENLFADKKGDTNERRSFLRNGFLYEHVTIMDDIKEVVRIEAPAILLVMAAAAVLGFREHWPAISTMYFCVMSATTTGFGDYTPRSQVDKLYGVFFMPLSVAVFGEVLGRIASIYVRRKMKDAERTFLRQGITRCDLQRMDTNHDGKVDMEEFLSFMLVALQKVDKESIDGLKLIFKSLDANGNGMLEKGDLVRLSKRHCIASALSEN
jgi:hypothetical protein